MRDACPRANDEKSHRATGGHRFHGSASTGSRAHRPDASSGVHGLPNPPPTSLPRSLTWVGCLCLATLCVLWGQDGRAQLQGMRAQLPGMDAEESDEQREDGADLENGLYLPTDRQLQRQLGNALKMVADAQWSDAAALLDEVLASDSDAFMPPEGASRRRSKADSGEHLTWRSVKTLAEEAIGSMAEEGRDAYDLQFRAKAERALSQAIDDGDMAAVIAVARRWFHTPSGAAAAMLAALDRLDAGDPFAANNWLTHVADSPGGARFEPTLSVLRAVAEFRAGRAASASSLLEKVRLGRKTDFRVAGRNENLASASDALQEWLLTHFGRNAAGPDLYRQDWLLFRGDAARNAFDTGDATVAAIGSDRGVADVGVAGRTPSGQKSGPNQNEGVNDSSMGGPRPLLAPRYRVPLARHPEEARGWMRKRRSLSVRDASRLPAASPLAIGERLLAMSPGGLLAIDFSSGKRVWLAPSPFPEIERPSESTQDPTQVVNNTFEPVFDDCTSGGLASDGRLVFVIESPAVTTADPTVLFQGPAAGMAAGNVRPGNVLSAYRLEDGSLAWRSPLSMAPVGGGEAGPRSTDSTAAGDVAASQGWFVGPPLPVGAELFVLVEHQGGLKLVSLDHDTGRLNWSQPLADLDDDLSVFGGRGSSRRVSGLSPSMAEGVLVCPTGAGALIAVDLSTRTLRWAYRYATKTDDTWMRMGNGMLIRRGNGVVAVMPGQAIPTPTNDPSTRRRDGVPVLADGRVVIAPRESDEIHCLDLKSGAVQWRRTAANCLYVAGIHDGRVILVGQHAVEARRLSDGEDAWQAPVLLGDTSPSGRGFLAGGRLYLPLETPEVMEIDQTTGRVVGRSPARNGAIPGNLVFHRGEVISQGIDSLDVFHQSQTLLKGIEAAGSDDGWKAYWLGQLLLDAGRTAEGLASVWQAHERSPASIDMDVVAESVLFALRQDFVTASRYWRQAVKDPTHALTDEILRAVVDGALASGDAAEAWEAYQLIARLSPVSAADGSEAAADPITTSTWRPDRALDAAATDDRLFTDSSDASVACSPDRWMRGRIERLRKEAAEPLRSRIDLAINAAFERAMKADLAAADAVGDRATREGEGPRAALWRLIDLFGGSDGASQAARSYLVGQPIGDERGQSDADRLKIDLMRLKVFRRGGVAQPADAVGESDNAVGERRAKRPPIERTSEPDDGDRRLTDETNAADGDAIASAAEAFWPLGRVTVEHVGQSANGRQGQRLQRPSRILPVPCAGALTASPKGLDLGAIRLSIDTQAGNAIVVTDGFGRRMGEPLPVDDASGRFAVVAAMQPSIADASVLGRLVVVRFGSTLAGFEVRPEGNRRLWTRSDEGPMPIQVNRQARVVVRRNAGISLGMRPVEPTDAGSADGEIQVGQAVTDGVPVLSQRTLDVCDPATGRVVWSRSKLPAAAEIFGDETCVVVCPRDGRKAMVLSMIDGRVLVTRDVPPREQRLATVGRSVVAIEGAAQTSPSADGKGDGPTWAPRNTLVGLGGRVSLVSIDPLSGHRLPLGTFAADARATQLEGEGLAVLEPDGRFTVVDVARGAPRFSVKLPAAPDTIEQLHVLPWQDRLIVAVGRPETPEEQRRLEGLGTITGVPSGGWQATEETILLTGSVWALDRKTGESIWPVPATVLRHGLPLQQPQDLPVLVFVRQIHSPSGEDRPRLSILCLDKRTGHAVYDDDRAGTDHHPLFSSEIVGDPGSHSVEISRGADRLRLVFDGRPIPPHPPYQATGNPTSSSGTLGTIGREFEKWMQRALQSLPF